MRCGVAQDADGYARYDATAAATTALLSRFDDVFDFVSQLSSNLVRTLLE